MKFSLPIKRLIDLCLNNVVNAFSDTFVCLKTIDTLIQNYMNQSSTFMLK